MAFCDGFHVLRAGVAGFHGVFVKDIVQLVTWEKCSAKSLRKVLPIFDLTIYYTGEGLNHKTLLCLCLFYRLGAGRLSP